jgi:phosphorylcholine metabolism protein LicD
MGYYNEECQMQEEKRERMRFVLRHILQFFNDENVTYWLDFGTLLGVIREGDIMAHDGDMDLSRLANNITADK